MDSGYGHRALLSTLLIVVSWCPFFFILIDNCKHTEIYNAIASSERVDRKKTLAIVVALLVILGGSVALQTDTGMPGDLDERESA